MIKISDRQVIDVVKYADDKAILVEKKPAFDGDSYKVAYYVLDFSTGSKDIITKDAYLLKKYGTNRKEISEKLGNFVMPETLILPDKQVLVLYPNGQMGLFDENGKLKKDGLLSYNESPICSIEQENEFFWTTCPNEDSVIRYLIDGTKMDLRIGGKGQETFKNPHFVSSDDDYVYVCCNHEKVRKIKKSDLTVSDVKGTFEGLTGYYKYGNCAIVTTTSVAYCKKDE